jgi:hypothetical protein
MVQVHEIMKAVDSNHDHVLSRQEYLACIRRDRKVADFVKMPPRIKQADGSLDQFISIFEAINVSRTGFITESELAAFMGVKPASCQDVATDGAMSLIASIPSRTESAVLGE